MESETVMYEVDCAGDEGTSSEDELQEVEAELEVLKADKVYHDFVSDVVHDRKIPEDESADPDFAVEPEGEPDKEGKIDLKDLVEEDSSSSSDESIYEEAVEDVEVKVPPASLKEAAARYPPFWKVNDKLHRDAMSGDNSDEDPEYKPPGKCGKCSQADGEAPKVGTPTGGDEKGETKGCEECHNEGNIDSDSDSSSASSSKAEIDDDEDVANLVEMVEEMALPGNDVEIQDVDDEEVQPDLIRSIVEHDDAAYKSDEDPDYVAPIDVDNVESDDGSSADDESSDNDEEQMQE